MSQATLHFFCGKMAAGKSTLARELAALHRAILLDEDQLLEALFPGEIHGIADYVKYSSRIKDALSQHVVALLASGSSVVLDFPGNTRTQRQWFRQLFERAQAAHELHYLEVPDEICKRQLQERSKGLPAGSAFTTDAEFEAITRYFQPPAADELFNVRVQVRRHATD
jgi:predicted kinase